MKNFEIPDNATNGDLFKLLFPNAKITEDFDEEYNVQVENLYQNNMEQSMWFDYQWWYAPQGTYGLKKNYWFRTTDETEHLVWECPYCKWQQRFWTNYCPNCGKDIGIKKGENNG